MAVIQLGTEKACQCHTWWLVTHGKIIDIVPESVHVFALVGVHDNEAMVDMGKGEGVVAAINVQLAKFTV